MKPEIKLAIDRYAGMHTPTGSFVNAVLRNDLVQAVCKADDDNRADLLEIVRYVYNEIPRRCWGSNEAVRLWLDPNICPPTCSVCGITEFVDDEPVRVSADFRERVCAQCHAKTQRSATAAWAPESAGGA